MGLDASQKLESAQLAGVRVNPRGFGKKMFGQMSGMYVGGLVGAAISAGGQQKAGKDKARWAATSETPKFGRLAYLAVTADELALVKLKSGLATTKLDDVLVRVPRAEVTSAELGKGFSPALTIRFLNGENWQLEVPRLFKKDGEEVVRLLGD